MSEAPKKSNPQLLDRVVGEIQDALIAGLPWLNFAFGIAERLVHEINGKEYYLPNVYRAENDYIEISPDDKDLHNHSFFTVDEPQYLDCVRGQKIEVRANCSLIVWVDMRSIEPTDERNKELVKRDILRVLNSMLLKSGTFTVNRVYEKAENIFQGFTLAEVDNQYLMHPYCGWRFVGEIRVDLLSNSGCRGVGCIILFVAIQEDWHR